MYHSHSCSAWHHLLLFATQLHQICALSPTLSGNQLLQASSAAAAKSIYSPLFCCSTAAQVGAEAERRAPPPPPGVGGGRARMSLPWMHVASLGAAPAGLYGQLVPQTVATFKKAVEEGTYDGTAFFKVLLAAS